MKKGHISHNAAKVPEVFRGIIDVATNLLGTKGMTAAEAGDVALDLAFALSDHFQGEIIYLPKATDLKADRRKRQVFKDYQGGVGYSALAKKHGITVTYAYQVVSDMRRLYLNDAKGKSGCL